MITLYYNNAVDVMGHYYKFVYCHIGIVAGNLTPGIIREIANGA